MAARGAEALAVRHLRRRPQPPSRRRLHCFVLDCSGSMAAGGALARAKGVLLALMEQAYRRRERVALLCFAGTRVELRLPPRKAAAWNDDWVAPIGAGGGTPLGPAVAQAARLLAQGGGEGWLWLLTDGRSRDRPARPRAAAQAHVIDFEQGRLRLGRAQALARQWDAACLHAGDWC
ncbi:MAG: VWA domain-containing protein [Pseudorhodoferax sp.]